MGLCRVMARALDRVSDAATVVFLKSQGVPSARHCGRKYPCVTGLWTQGQRTSRMFFCRCIGSARCLAGLLS